MAKRLKVAVLISGRGSNMESLLKAASEPSYPAKIVLVLSNRPEAPGLEKARQYGIETQVVDHKTYRNRESFDGEMHEILLAKGVEFIALAGFMRLLSQRFVEDWRDRMINIHPALLPLFPGLDTHERALEAGVKIHGCSVHFLRHEMDTGPLIGQAAVPVLHDDTPESLAARVLEAEHQLYPLCLKLVAEGQVKITGGNAQVLAKSPGEILINPIYSS